MIKFAVLIFLFVFTIPFSADAFCFEEAGAKYSVSPELLKAIAYVESRFNPDAMNRNGNGSYDFGLMQINSTWRNRLGENIWSALSDPCLNVNVGAWIVADCFNRYGYTWNGVGCYNASAPDKRSRYALKVYEIWQLLKNHSH